MRTLHLGLRVADLDRSLAFYKAVGYEVVGEVPDSDIGHLTMLRLPDDEFVSLELVHDPGKAAAAGVSRLCHFAVHVESMDSTLRELASRGICVGTPTSPDGSADFWTTSIVDPDGNRIELVQWPAGHADGLTAQDWPSSES